MKFYLKPQYRTFSFWFCVVMALADVFFAAIVRQIPAAAPFAIIFLLSASLFVVGAASHYFLDKALRE